MSPWKRQVSPAITFRQAGNGGAVYAGFLPGLTYFKPAIPRRPVDRRSSDDAMCHFIPTAFDPGAERLLRSLTHDVARPAVCSNRLVQASMIESPHGVAIALVNWSDGPVKKLKVTINVDVPGNAVRLASGKPVKARVLSARAGAKPSRVCTLDLDVADALIFE